MSGQLPSPWLHKVQLQHRDYHVGTEICCSFSWFKQFKLTGILKSEVFPWLKWELPEILNDSGKPLSVGALGSSGVNIVSRNCLLLAIAKFPMSREQNQWDAENGGVLRLADLSSSVFVCHVLCVSTLHWGLFIARGGCGLLIDSCPFCPPLVFAE